MASGSVASENRSAATGREACCGKYHQAVELVGKRWTGAILFVLMDGPLRFSEVKVLVPDLSDRLLSELAGSPRPASAAPVEDDDVDPYAPDDDEDAPAR